MKVQLHVPVEQYGFVAADIETDNPNTIREAYAAIARAFQAQDGIPEKEFNQFIDAQLAGVPNHIEMWERMSDKQKDAAQVLKRALKRREYKNK